MKAKEMIGHLKAGKIIGALEKYRYALLVALCGILLMALPLDGRKTTTVQTAEVAESRDVAEVEARLEALLAASAGVGRVKVMLTLEHSEEVIYMTEGSESTSEGGSDSKQAVSKVNGADGEQALVTRRLSPVYRGAIILCDGAGDDGVRLRVTAAVSSLLGLGSDRIAVLPMEAN